MASLTAPRASLRGTAVWGRDREEMGFLCWIGIFSQLLRHYSALCAPLVSVL